MSHTLDPGPIMAALAERAAGAPGPPRGNGKALREAGQAGQANLARLAPVPFLTWTYDDNFTVWSAIPRRRPVHRGPLATEGGFPSIGTCIRHGSPSM